ncbi:hypothetical protein M6B38_316925 [Iris pallida]|uniref:Uncharacterized protein n=1 Tax=Iris pallida TaxID=29817 RepID=A0AAX6HFT9_IRIPA|nr:hypothetical protein M6B38_316925 [Iris pallida]
MEFSRQLIAWTSRYTNLYKPLFLYLPLHHQLFPHSPRLCSSSSSLNRDRPWDNSSSTKNSIAWQCDLNINKFLPTSGRADRPSWRIIPTSIQI